MNDCSGEPGLLRLKEYNSCQTHQVNEVQRQALDKYFGKFLKISPTWQPGICEIKTQQYVGTIILDDLHIIIQPKVPIDNLFYMLTYAYDLPQFRQEVASLDFSEDLFEFIVAIFVKQVEELIRSGIYRSYLDLEENQAFLRGRLMLGEQLHQNAVQVHRFYQRINEYTADVLENRILHYTLHLLAQLDYRNASMKKQIRRTLSVFHDVALTHISPADCDRVVYTRLNAAYHSRIHLARLLLQNLSLEGKEGRTPFAAYILDMNQVFELFVARYLADYFADHFSLDVGIQDDIWLDEGQKEKGTPDIVLQWNGRPHLVLDTKYKIFKDKPSQDDRNQMLVYCQTLNLTRGMLIYANEQAIKFDSKYSGTLLSARALSLNGRLSDFRRSCEKFARNIVDVENVVVE